MKITTIGLDLSKSVFQIHGIDETGTPVLTKHLRWKQMERFFARLPSCLIGIEACATSHHWARVLVGFGHEVKLMPPSYVKAHVKRSKNDAADAEAICEAVRRPTMRFVPIKSPDQQSVLMVHRARSLVVRQRTMAANALRAHLAEFGRVANPGIQNLRKLARATFDKLDKGKMLLELARTALAVLVRRLVELEEELQTLDRTLLAWHKENEASRRLVAVPGIGAATATAIAATVSDPEQFRSGH
jgi:transposase